MSDEKRGKHMNISLRVSREERERFEALVPPGAPLAFVLRAAMLRGLEAIESDPSILLGKGRGRLKKGAKP